jgi:1-acyl-sn-glycerol-3-phosphate acyltransferase
MKRVGMLPIARHQREKVLKIYQEAEGRVAKGECFALAPEGTRQSKRELGRFKTGPFIFAVNAQVPIVPLVLAGALDIQPKGHFLFNTRAWKSRVIMDVGEPIPTKGLGMDQLPQLQEEVRGRMEATYKRLNQELGLGPV